MRQLVRLLALFCAIVIAVLVQPQRSAYSSASVAVYLPLLQHDIWLTPTNNLPVSAATYLGGLGDDAAYAVDVAPDGHVVFAGTLPGYDPRGVTPVHLLGGGDAAVVRLNSTGQSVESVSRIGARIVDLEINAAGRIVVCGNFGVAVLSDTADSVIWNADFRPGSRCSIGHDGVVAMISDGRVIVYNANGTLLGSWNIGGSAQQDVAVDWSNGFVIATGYEQKTTDLQVAFVKAWSYTGALKWKAYDFSADDVVDAGLGADTRGERVVIGRDGKLYFAGTINGGAGTSIFSRDPKNITLKLGSDRNIITDQYNEATNVGAITMAWYGRYDPATGALEQGQSLLTRLSNGRGNSIKPRAIAADEYGRVYLVGAASCCIDHREARQVAGVPVGSYASEEAFLLVVQADFKQRVIWTPFAGPRPNAAGGSPAVGVGVRSGIVAVTATLNSGTLITANALQRSPVTLPDAYIAVWHQ